MYNNEPTVAFLKDYHFFTPLDIVSTLLGISILLVIVYLRSHNNRDLSHYSYYKWSFLFKLFFVFANATFYIVFYGGGGDSIAYWDGAVKLNQLFWKDPVLYFEELFEWSETRSFYKNFDTATGFPDSRIYQEPASFFVSKIASVFTFFTFKGYILMSMIFAFITTNVSWRLYEFVRSLGLHSDWHAALAVLFIPSLSFWCGGISKDTLMWIAVCYFIIHMFKILSLEHKTTLWNWIIVVLMLYVMFRVRSFMIVTVFAPLMLSFSARVSKKFGPKSFEGVSLKTLLALGAVAAIFLFFQTSIADEFLKEAAIINQDMTTNKTYGTNRYSLGEVDYTPLGMVMAMPASVMAGFFRPFIWESLSVSLILNGFESLLLMFFTFRFFVHRKVLERIKRIRSHEFLIYGFFFALILAYFAGFTSILFGVLVRFKAPVLPFLVLILTAHYLPEKKSLEETKN